MIEQLQGQAELNNGINEQLLALYEPCGHQLPNLSDEEIPDDLIVMINKMLRRIYAAKALPDVIDYAVTEWIAKKLYKAVEDGFGKTLLTVDFTTPDYLVLRNLQADVYQFAAAKNYHQLKDLTQSLIGKDGKLRSFSEFKKTAVDLIGPQVTTYMQAEYNFAVAGGQMSATWQRIQENKGILPLLKYVTVGDKRVRPEHQELEAVTRPVDDSFWDIYYPPNGWNCRCDVMSLASGKLTPVESIVTPEKMPEIFKTNLAKTGLIFPQGHPYYTGLPTQVKEQAEKLISKLNKKDG